MQGARGFAIQGACVLGLVSMDMGWAQESGTARIGQEIAFARGLAEDFGFLELAEEVLEGLSGTEGLDEEMRGKIELESCDLGLLKAQEQSEIQRKWALVHETLRKIGQSVERLQNKQLGVEACELYLRGALDFVEILEFMLEVEAEAGARAGMLREAEEVLKTAIAYAHEIRLFCQPRLEFDSDARCSYYWAWLTQGELTKDWTLLAPEADRPARLLQAKQTIRDFIFSSGEETIAGTRGLILLAECYEIEGKVDDSWSIYVDVIYNIWKENLRNPEKEIPASTIPLLSRLMEEAYFVLIRLNNRLGRTNEAVAAGAEMIARIREIAVTCKAVQHSVPQGLRALVEYAEALRKAGEAEKALLVAADVSARGRNAVAGFWARRLMERILDEPAAAARIDPWLAVKASTGWLEWRHGIVREAQGLDRLARAMKETMPRLFAQVDTEKGRYTLEWYRIVCHYAYVAYRAGLRESRHLEEARRLLALARGGEGFVGVKGARPMQEEKAVIEELAPGALEREPEELFQFFLYLSNRLEE